MATVKANAPINYTNSSGSQQLIPLSALSIDAGTVNPSKWPPFAKYGQDEQNVIKGWLAYLVAANLVQATPEAAPVPAMKVSAAEPGSFGNNIQVTIGNYAPGADPTDTPFPVTVTETDEYCNLMIPSASSSSSSSSASSSSLSSASSSSSLSSTSSLSSASSMSSTSSGSSSSSSPCPNAPVDISVQLGTDTTAGKQPGLLHVVGLVDPTRVPAVRSYNVTGGAPGVKAKVDILDGSSARVFTLEAKKPNDNGTTVRVVSVDPIARTFSLEIIWSNTISVTTANAAQKLASAMGYVVSFTGPGGGAFSLPNPSNSGPTSLTGGADGASPSTASAVIFTRT